MKKEAIHRDPLQQNKYKDALKAESVKIYGSEICWASKMPYKGLIASHIKPYKICVLEGDEEAQFSINNGILISKAVDDYFDKLLLTFDENGHLIFSDDIPEAIKDEFSSYSLDAKVYNETRKAYMRIHRSLFYYKNYCQADPNYNTDRLDNIDIPFVDCGIRIYKEKVIVSENGGWKICPTRNLKTVFTERTQNAYKIKAVISSSDLYNKLIQNSEYILPEIQPGFYTKGYMVDLRSHTTIPNNSRFKICCTGYDIKKGKPTRYIDYLLSIFQDNNSVDLFRRLIAFSMLGEGYNHSIVLKGDIESIESLIDTIKRVLGSYVYDYTNGRAIVKDEVPSDILPNCRLLVLRPRKAFENNVLAKLIDNTFFSKTVLNFDRYVPLIIYNQKATLDNSIEFELKRLLKQPNMTEILDEEGSLILGWILSAITNDIDDSLTVQTNVSRSDESVVYTWMNDRCVISKQREDTVSATDLYEDYQVYMRNQQYSALSMKRFCMEISKYLSKKRTGAGIFYTGIKLKL